MRLRLHDRQPGEALVERKLRSGASRRSCSAGGSVVERLRRHGLSRRVVAANGDEAVDRLGRVAAETSRVEARDVEVLDRMARARQADRPKDVVGHHGAVRVHDRGAVHVRPAEATVAGWHGLQR